MVQRLVNCQEWLHACHKRFSTWQGHLTLTSVCLRTFVSSCINAAGGADGRRRPDLLEEAAQEVPTPLSRLRTPLLRLS